MLNKKSLNNYSNADLQHYKDIATETKLLYRNNDASSNRPKINCQGSKWHDILKTDMT